MIGTVGSPAKAAVALEHGYDAVIDYTAEDFAARTLELTGGRGVDVIYDGIGKAAFLRSLACIRPRGMVVSYGRSEEHTSELQSLMRISYAVFCLKKKNY